MSEEELRRSGEQELEIFLAHRYLSPAVAALGIPELRGGKHWRLLPEPLLEGGRSDDHVVTIRHSLGIKMNLIFNSFHSLAVIPLCSVHGRPAWTSSHLPYFSCLACMDAGGEPGRSKSPYSRIQYFCPHAPREDVRHGEGQPDPLRVREAVRWMTSLIPSLGGHNALELELRAQQLAEEFMALQENWCSLLSENGLGLSRDPRYDDGAFL